MKKVFWLIALIILLTSYSEPNPEYSQGSGAPLNVVLLIGDGLGLSHITAALYSSRNEFVLEKFPVVGFQKCHSIGNIISESASNATAMACGIKTLNHRVGVDENGNRCKSILEEAKERGLATGAIVTSSIVHATPAAFYAHRETRTLYEEIAEDFVDSDIDIAIGGGKKYFDRRGKDKRNLIDELRKKRYVVLDYFQDDFNSFTPSPRSKFLFFTADNHPVGASQGRDYLPRAAKISLDYLRNRSNNGFLLLIEGSQIDWACHANQGSLLLSEMQDFTETVEQVLSFAKQNRNTLVIVTSDHETGGLAINPGSTTKRLELKFTTNGHTGVMVPLFAYGPGSEFFHGIYDNTEIYHRLRKALNWR